MAVRRVTPTSAVSARLVDTWLAGHASANTRSAYRTDLAMFGRWCAQHHSVPLAADTATLAAFGLARQAAGDSDATMRRRWSSLSSFFQYAVHTGNAASNPVDGVDRPVELSGNPSRTTLLSADAVDACLAMAALLDPRLEALVAMLVRDGIKLGEALAIDVDDISGRPPRTSVTIRRNGKTRRVTLDESTARALRRCAGRRTDQPLFISDHRARTRTPQRLSRFGADHLLRQLRYDNDERVTANELRRFYITSQHQSGAALDDLRDDAGLSDTRGITRFVAKHQPSPASSATPTAAATPIEPPAINVRSNPRRRRTPT
ncbi:MAG: site-specific integrase [Actinobacteria bacterium]|jgi:integrase/recombinase XerD|nr:site-specific integrase [Ilumatobacteraceae bacterium]NMD25569.1 site-specific integrase [Actinomycetota bacterium]HRA85263.1 site-specific integrase [Ilumatobacteraceae bacterium]HRC48408.1 site-specific integrase [Ilumatobacteraceae bacterium]